MARKQRPNRTAGLATDRIRLGPFLSLLSEPKNAPHEVVCALEGRRRARKSKRLGELQRQLQGLLGALEQEEKA